MISDMTPEERAATLLGDRSPRRWIISKSLKVCPNYCEGYDKQNAKVAVTDAVLGAYSRECRDCGRREVGYLDSFKAMRPCRRCKDVHDVTVGLWNVKAGDAKLTEHWKDTCATCDIEISAASHYQQAKTFFARAEKLREAQKKKLLRKEAAKLELVEAGSALRSVKKLVERGTNE